jgi:putative transposase
LDTLELARLAVVLVDCCCGHGLERGDCFDNAVAESFFARLKKELIRRQSRPTRAELRQAVFEYIEIFYNATRRHSTLGGMLSPIEFEKISQSPDQED